MSDTVRQQVLYLWASGSALDSDIVGWAFHDGTAGAGPGVPLHDDGDVPYASGEAALRDGWMLLQSAPLVPPTPGTEHRNAYLEYEFVLERRIEL